MVQKQVKKALKQKKRKRTKELRIFKKMSVCNSNQESKNNSSSEEGEVCKIGSGELYTYNNNHSSKKFNQYRKIFKFR